MKPDGDLLLGEFHSTPLDRFFWPGRESQRRAVLILLILLVGLAGLAAWASLRNTDWSPLGPFPIQTIADETGDDNTIDIATGVVQVTGTKCRGEQAIQVEGSLAWRQVIPPGFIAPALVFPATSVLPGCTTQTFDNRIPAAVAEVVCSASDLRSVWEIAGVERPVAVLDVDGAATPRSKGLQLGWVTETFTLTCNKGTS